MDTLAAYGALFLSALAAATIVPAQSEAILGGLHLSGRHSTLLLVVVATAGNVLGSVLNWLLGRYLEHFRHRRWFPVKEASLAKAQAWYSRWGVASLLFAWVPLIGDPLTLVAGILRTNFWVFLLLVALGKAGRYAALVALL